MVAYNAALADVTVDQCKLIELLSGNVYLEKDHRSYYSAIVVNAVTLKMRSSDVKDAVGHFPVFHPIGHPDPGKLIRIKQVFSRIHIHNMESLANGPHELTIAGFRLSDGAIIGGAVLDATKIGNGSVTATPLFNIERLFDYGDKGFVLAPNDGLIAIGANFSTPDNTHDTGHFMAIAWERL